MSIWNRLQSTFRRPREIESRIDDELQFHLDMKTDELTNRRRTSASGGQRNGAPTTGQRNQTTRGGKRDGSRFVDRKLGP